jgi:hypothetical protein
MSYHGVYNWVGNVIGMVGKGNAYSFFEDASWKINVNLEGRIRRDRRETEREGPK